MNNDIKGIEIMLRSDEGCGYVVMVWEDCPWEIYGTVADAHPFDRSRCHLESVTMHFQDESFRTFPADRHRQAAGRPRG